MEVRVRAPSRLHFGMFSFNQPDVRRYGGVGAMIEEPGIQLSITRAKAFSASGPLAERVEEFAARMAKAWGQKELRCRIEAVQAPPQHVGLGVGTQLGLSVAVGLSTFFNRKSETIESLARAVGRGARSAIGLYGFQHGGLLVEAGKRSDDEISPLIAREILPDDWRWVLVRPQNLAGLSGMEERSAFRDLPPVPSEATDALCRETLLNLLPAAVAGDFDAFSESLFCYGKLAGECFASQQGGTFVRKELLPIVEWLRESGVQGVGQTSWGPTLFALTSNQPGAESLVQKLKVRFREELVVTISRPCNSGARIETN